MATIKSYTDISQSKKLAEILPLESADMGWNVFVDDTTRILPINDWNLVKDGSGNVKFYHAWSLVSLLGVLPLVDFTTPQLVGTPKTLYRCMYNDDLKSHAYDNPVDACYDMIIRLNELNLL